MSTYYTLLTKIGLAKIANAQSSGSVVQWSQMAVGDGNGAAVTPTETQTALVHETYRASINRLAVDDINPNYLIAELVIPATTGGFTIREVGIFDTEGNLVAVANSPENYKPVLSEGSATDLVVRVIVMVSNTDAVQLKIDPSVVLATRKYVDDSITTALNKQDGKQSVRVATTAAITLSGLLVIDGVQLASGDRVLVKDQASGKDNGIYVAASGAWFRATDADASIEVTPGLFVTVEQGTVNADSLWQLVTDGAITLGTTALTFEMAAGKTGVVAGSYNKVTVDKYGRVVGGTNPTTLAGYGITDAINAGAIIYVAKSSAPTGYLKANGAAISRTAYADLFAAIGTIFGAGDGLTTFNLPDLRGEFIRGWDDGRGIDTGRSIGSSQTNSDQSHKHISPINDTAATLSLQTARGSDWPNGASAIGVAGCNTISANVIQSSSGEDSWLYTGTNVYVSGESRPRNIALLACIKY